MRPTDNTFRNALIAAGIVGGLASITVATGWRLFEFDAALFVYAEALVLSLVLTAYRITVWVHRPPTLLLYQRAWKMFARQPGMVGRLRHVVTRSIGYFALNTFVWKRGWNRWGAHWPIMIGCVMALGIVLPLILGWIWFETPPDDFHAYQITLFGQHIRTMPVEGIEAFVAFHGLVWASFPVVAGTSVALWRRTRDRGDQATQTIANDFVPLLALLAIAVTGLLMTVSYSFLGGALHQPLALLHCMIVVATLWWLPYSKLLHIPQRSLKLAHMVYEHDAPELGQAYCQRCGRAFANQQQVLDLIEIEKMLGYRYEMSMTSDHYQWICPPCRRATLVIAQGKRWGNRWQEASVSPQLAEVN